MNKWPPTLTQMTQFTPLYCQLSVKGLRLLHRPGKKVETIKLKSPANAHSLRSSNFPFNYPILLIFFRRRHCRSFIKLKHNLNKDTEETWCWRKARKKLLPIKTFSILFQSFIFLLLFYIAGEDTYSCLVKAKVEKTCEKRGNKK